MNIAPPPPPPINGAGNATDGVLPGEANRDFMQQVRSKCKDDLGYQRRLFDRSKARRWEDFNRFFLILSKNVLELAACQICSLHLKKESRILKRKMPIIE